MYSYTTHILGGSGASSGPQLLCVATHQWRHHPSAVGGHGETHILQRYMQESLVWDMNYTNMLDDCCV